MPSASSRCSIRYARVLVFAALMLASAAPSLLAQHRRREARRARVRVNVDVHRRGGFWRGVAVGAAVASLPRGHRAIVVGGRNYFYYEGAYYAPQGRGYVVVAPPVGAVIAAVPPGCAAVAFGTAGYHYCGGTFYAPATGGFAVVETPIGVTVDELPVGCEETVDIAGVAHYSCGGIFYKPVVQGSETLYITVRR